MSKKSVYHRNLKRLNKSLIYQKRRITLKNKIRNKSLTGEEVFAAVLEFQKLPRDASPVRIRNRCYLSGRARGIIPQFGISRIWFRRLAGQNYLPGVSKYSW